MTLNSKPTIVSGSLWETPQMTNVPSATVGVQEHPLKQYSCITASVTIQFRSPSQHFSTMGPGIRTSASLSLGATNHACCSV